MYLRTFGGVLVALGLVASVLCWSSLRGDESYYKALRALEKYPGNVLYTTELRMAEPRHMLLGAGTAMGLPMGLVFGSLCLGLAELLAGRGREA